MRDLLRQLWPTPKDFLDDLAATVALSLFSVGAVFLTLLGG